MEDFHLFLLKCFFYPCITVLLLYLFEKKYSYKSKLINLIGSTTKYKVIIVLLHAIPSFAYIFITSKNPFLNPVFLSLFLSNGYLTDIPNNIELD